MSSDAMPEASDPGGPDKPAARRGRPRDSGVDAAIRWSVMDLLGEAGYGHLTMEQVAARAKVSKDTDAARLVLNAGKRPPGGGDVRRRDAPVLVEITV